MRAVGLAGIALLGAGVALLADAVLRGGATVSLVVIVPVVSGSSGEFLLGVVCLVAGVFLLPFLGFELGPPGEETLPPPSARASTPSESSSGGLVLIGPVPIFFGAWRSVPTRTRRWVAIAGGIVLVLFLVGVLFALR